MNTGLFKSLKRSDVPLTDPGYLKAFISLKDDFTTLQEPTPGQTPALGDAYTISTAHVWAAGKGAIEVLVDRDTLEVSAKTSGAKGSLKLNYAPKLFLKGDSAAQLEILNNWMNEDLILFVQDQCNPAQYIQFGCDCSPAQIDAGTFASGTSKGNNAKGYEITLDVPCKYFYDAALTKL